MQEAPKENLTSNAIEMSFYLLHVTGRATTSARAFEHCPPYHTLTLGEANPSSRQKMIVVSHFSIIPTILRLSAFPKKFMIFEGPKKWRGSPQGAQKRELGCKDKMVSSWLWLRARLKFKRARNPDLNSNLCPILKVSGTLFSVSFRPCIVRRDAMDCRGHPKPGEDKNECCEPPPKRVIFY